MDISRDRGRIRITAEDYALEVRPGPPRAVLADRSGRIWSALVLLADLDTTEGRDETYRTSEPEAWPDGAAATVEVVAESRRWAAKVTRLRCTEQAVELDVTVTGSGTLADVRLLGGHAVLPDGAAGAFRSGIEFASLFSPAPTEPVQVVRPAWAAAALGVVGDARPGRWHAVGGPGCGGTGRPAGGGSRRCTG
jgi:hypothetical protein